MSFTAFHDYLIGLTAADTRLYRLLLIPPAKRRRRDENDTEES